MGGPLLILAALASARAQPCEDPRDAVDDAVDALILMDTAKAWKALEDAEAGLGCGAPPEPATLARFWLVEGGLLHFDRDADGAAASFRAAARVDPTAWIVDLGPDLLDAYEKAKRATPKPGELALDPIDPHYEVRLDLSPVTLGEPVESGAHLLQILLDDEVRYGLIVVVLADRKTVIESHLPPIIEPPAPSEPEWVPAQPVPEAPVKTRASTGLFGWGGGGLAFGYGERLERRGSTGATVIEPSARLFTVVEGGVSLRSTRAWTRGSVGAAPMLGGRLLWADDSGIRETPIALTGALAGGVGLGGLDLGLHAGVLLPSRVQVGAVGSLQVGRSHGCLEARLGANLIPDRLPEPTFAVLGTVCPEAR